MKNCIMRQSYARNSIIFICILFLLTLAMIFPQPLAVTANAANADGSLTKIATYCVGATQCTSSNVHSSEYAGSCSCGQSVRISGGVWCGDCNGFLSSPSWTCPSCGSYHPSMSGSGHESVNCVHGKSRAHYYNTEYGYDGSSSTFIVWPITIITKGGITASYSVSGVTATDAALVGKQVQITFQNLPTTVETVISDADTGEIRRWLSSSQYGGYSFIVSAKPTTLIVSPAKEAQSLTITTPVSKTYNAPRFNLNVLVGQ